MSGYGLTGEIMSSAGEADDRSLVGRRHRLQTAREWLLSGGSVLFFGPVGVGKSAAVDLVTAAAVQSRVLRCSPTLDDDAGRPFGALADLLSSITMGELDAVPAPRRTVLASVVAGDLDAVAPAAIRLAVLNLFRVLARSRPLLLIVDDLHLVDEASADVLRFVAQRVEDLPVQMAAAERVAPDGLPLRRGLCPPPLLVVRLDQVASDTDQIKESRWRSGPRSHGCRPRDEERDGR
jgi:MoxR-like ATPase